MSTPTVPSPAKPFDRTLAFRWFERKHIELSEAYWFAEACRLAAKQMAATRPADEFLVTHLGASTDVVQCGAKCGETADAADHAAGVQRLHLLVLCSANLEAFLKDAVRAYVLGRGPEYRTSDIELSEHGEAIAKPVLGYSSIPAMLVYVEALLGIRLGNAREVCSNAYSLRCIAAHQGGVLTTQSKIKFGQRPKALGDIIRVSWADLKDLLAATYTVAETIDRAVYTDQVRDLEVERFYMELHRLGKHSKYRGEFWASLASAGMRWGNPLRKRLRTRFGETPRPKSSRGTS